MNLSAFECSVCYGVYSDKQKPRALPCGHTFCEPCLNNLKKEEFIPCPKCQTHNSGEVEHLTIIYDLIPSNEILNTKVSLMCSIHEQQQKFWCMTCLVPTCAECQLQSHNKHDFLPIEDSAGKKLLEKFLYKEKTTNLIRDLDDYVARCENGLSTLSAMLVKHMELIASLKSMQKQLHEARKEMNVNIESEKQTQQYLDAISIIDEDNIMPDLKILDERITVMKTWRTELEVMSLFYKI